MFKKIYAEQEITPFITDHQLAFLYISKTNCSVCHSLLPQVEAVLTDYPKIKTAHINVDDIPAVAGRFSVFTVPVLLLFAEGKEYLREARIVHLDQFREKLDKIYPHF